MSTAEFMDYWKDTFIALFKALIITVAMRIFYKMYRRRGQTRSEGDDNAVAVVNSSSGDNMPVYNQLNRFLQNLD